MSASPAVERAVDVDSHEQIPQRLWPEHFGAAGEEMAAIRFSRIADDEGADRDDAPISEQSVWELRGPRAPAAIDLHRRPAVLDAMGVDRQLVFPTFALYGMHLAFNPRAADLLGFEPSGLDVPALGRRVLAAHNTWAAAIGRDLGGRVRPVGVMLADTVEQMTDDLSSLLADGLSAVFVPAGVPPGGCSPADRALDCFWAALAEARVPLVMHQGTEFALFASTSWWGSHLPEAAFRRRSRSIEFEVDPYNAIVTHYCMENYLQAMILGGVFDRHPGLIVGIVEACAHWVGPLADKLDIVTSAMSARYFASLQQRPSEYLVSNVRVSPHNFEPVDRYLERHPQLADVLCYGSDYPHAEGGQWSKRAVHERLARLGADVVERFFVTNGAALVPER